MCLVGFEGVGNRDALSLQCSTKRGWGGVRANAGVTKYVERSSSECGVERGMEVVKSCLRIASNHHHLFIF